MLFVLVICVAFVHQVSSCITGLDNPCGKRGRINVECVRSYLSTYGGVSKVHGRNLDPYKPTPLHMFLPYFNVTLVKAGSTYEGLSNSKLENFVVDYDNNVTIIYVNHTYLEAYGPLDVIFHRPGSASLRVATVYKDTYKNYTTTTLIPGTTSLDLNCRQTHPYITNYTVTFGDDNFANYINNNPFVASVVQAISNNIDIVMKEVHLTMSKKFSDGYIGQNLCALPGDEAYAQVNPTIL